MAGERDGRLLVVVNAAAGTAARDAVDAALAVLRAGADVAVAATPDVTALGEALAARDGRRVVVVGGDGSVHAVVAALHRDAGLDPRDPLGLIPLGTGNDLARRLALPLDPAEAARVVLDGRPRPVDLVVDDAGGVMVNAAHLGVGAEAGRLASGWKPRLGVAAYPAGAVAAAVSVRGWALTVEVDGTVVHGPDEPVLMVGVTNSRSIGGGTPLAPEGVPDDGLLDVVVSTSVGPLARTAYGFALRDGSHFDRRDVATHTGRTARVRAASERDAFRVNTDGEVSAPVAARVWTLHHGGWAVLVPRPAR